MAPPLQSAPLARAGERGCGFGAAPSAAEERPSGAENSYALLASSAARAPDARCLGWRPPLPPGAPPPDPAAPPDPTRPYAWWTYADVLAMATDAGAGLVARYGLEKGDRVGFYARNCPWWSCVMYACVSQGLVVVPIYDTLGEGIVEYVCNHAEAKVVVVSEVNAAKLRAALPKCATVKGVVLIEGDGGLETTAGCAAAVAAGFGEAVDAAALADVRAAAAAAENPAAPSTAAWDDLYCIMYTSGTTGDPKGVTLTNRAMMSSVASGAAFFKHHGAEFTPADSCLSYLPLSHIFEQQAQAFFVATGGRVGFFTGDIKLLLDDLTALQPTVFIGVPRVYARFQERIKATVEGGGFIKRKLYEMAYARQLSAVRSPPTGAGAIARSGIWDTLVFSKVKAKLLPNARLCITGSAPLSEETNDFLKVNLNCPVVQGYGLTETVGGMVCSAPSGSPSGTCGGPLPGVTVKLADLPDMGYLTTDAPFPRGEICVKGSIVTAGYYKNEAATKAAFDEEGYFKTGDVGTWTDDGALRIIDRAKNLFKLSQGEYVSPDALENELGKAKLVAQIYVYGNSLESTLLAVVVPDGAAAKAWAAANAPGASDLAAIGAKPEFKAALLAQLAAEAKAAKLKRYEYIKDVYVETGDLNELGQGFHVDNNLTTPTFKLKRPQLSNKYKETLDAMYAAAK